MTLAATRVLFVAESVTLAHRARPFVLASALEGSQYEIIFASDRRYDRLFSVLPGRREDLFSIESSQFLAALAKGDPVYDEVTLSRYVEDDLALIERTKPDLIVSDFRLSLSVSARLRQVPYIAISNLYWSPFAIQRYTVPELPLTRVLGVPLAQAVFDLMRPIAFSLHTVPLNKVRRRFGLPSLGRNLGRVYTDADHTLYADLPGLIQTRQLPPEHRCIGPILWSPDVPLPAWWDAIDDTAPVIYMTPGSSGDVDGLSMLVDALAELPAVVMVATAGRWQAERRKENVFCADFLPGTAAARRASLVVCNGGSLATTQALAEGTPVIGIPRNLDQYLNMAGIETFGAGVSLRSGRVHAKRLRSTARALLDDPGYRRRAGEIKREIEGMPCGPLFREALADVESAIRWRK